MEGHPARHQRQRQRVDAPHGHLTPAQAKAGGTLNIGLVDDIDMTFVNGHPVGNTSSWSDERHYRVPASYLKAGANEVMVLVTSKDLN